MTRTGKVGVIGTSGTIKSSAYAKAIKRINPEIVPLTSLPLEQIGEGFKAAKAGKYAKVIIVP